MYCSGCGEKLVDGAIFCGNCGKAVVQPAAYVRHSEALIGFSTKINDPAFKKYRKNSVGWSFLFSAILAVIAVVSFPIYGKLSGEIEWPNSLLYGMGIGGMFLLIALLQTVKKGLDRTWDGTVVYKDSFLRRERDSGGMTECHPVYILKIKKDSGGVKTHRWRDSAGPYDYYSVGDRVRHHKGFYYYEKYDKSRDSQIMCAACQSFHDITNDICPRCKCPLLK